MPSFTRESGGTLHVAVMGVNRIGKVQTTARYAHLARDTVKASAARIGDSIDQDLDAAER